MASDAHTELNSSDVLGHWLIALLLQQQEVEKKLGPCLD
jgi:hypothetical protein